VLAHTPGIDCHFDFGLPHREDVFTCLAETMALAAVNWQGHFSVGQIKMEQVEQIVKIVERVGFSPADMTTFTRLINSGDIERIYKARKAYLASKSK